MSLETPIDCRLGAYRLLERLGDGAMGTVYAARDEEERRAVALKVIHPHLLERRGFFKRFQREAAAGERVCHANVVRTLDVDFQVVEGRPQCFLVMEYVEGRTLRDLLCDEGKAPEALVREIATQAAAGLEAIHAAGIVHRDLKPENVLITKDHEIRIMDLGVARLLDASAVLTKEGQFAGSLLYAAPEQFLRDPVGPAADLYALGVVMHELATGRNPFRRVDSRGVAHAHLEEIAPPIDAVDPDLSPFLAEVVATLLEKEAQSRFPSAAALRTVLEEGEGSTWWAEQAEVLRRREAHVPRVPVRRETALYGREEELALLRESWRRAQDGQGTMLLLEGEAGIGKSRLLDGFFQDLNGDPAHVLYGSYAPSGGMGALSAALLGHFGPVHLEAALAPYLAATPALVPAFAALLKCQPPREGGPEPACDALHAMFVQLLHGLAKEKPLLWVVEDIHYAIADSCRILLSLAQALDGHRVLLLLTSRPELSRMELLPFSRVATFRHTELRRLPKREVTLLLRDALRSETLADRLGARIALKSDGVPLFVLEMIRGLEEAQLITKRPDGSYVQARVIEEIAVPSTVKDLITARLGDLTSEERTTLEVAAVEGFEFDPLLVAAVTETRPLALLQRLASVARRTGVVKAAGRRYRFDHHQIQEVVDADLSDGLREEYHMLIAEAFAKREGVAARHPEDLPGETACFLARHHLWGREPRAALPFLEPALDHLTKICRNDPVLEIAGRALGVEGLLTGADRGKILLRKARTLDLLGRREEGRAALAEARSLERQ